MRVGRAWLTGLMVLGTTCEAASCALSESEVGSSVAAVTVTYAAGGTINPIEQEPSAVWTRLSANGVLVPALVVGYNDESAASLPGGSPMGWAISLDQGQTFPQRCTSTTCGGIDTSRVGGFKQFLRHPSLATDGNGNVVYVTLADKDGDLSNAEVVVAALSTNNGLTFDTAFPVNQDSCFSGKQDMPHAVFDYTTSPATLWIAWRNNSSGSSFGGCIRRFFIDTSIPAIVPLEEARGIDGMDRENLTGSQGGLMVGAGDGIVTVAYANSDENDSCPTGEHHGRAWATVSTFDNGHTWIDNARIFHSDTWRSCLSNPKSGNVQNSIRDFDFVRTPTGIEYAVIGDTPETVRFFMNPAGGAKGWKDPTDTADPWLEWCPGTLTADAGGVPTWNWRRHDDGPCTTELFKTLADPDGGSGPFKTMLPTLAADGNGRVTVALLQFKAAAKGQGPTVFTISNANPLLPGSGWVGGPGRLDFAPADLPTAVSVPQATDVQPFGAYFTMIPRQPAGSLTAPGCTDNGDFFPLWVRASDDAGLAQIATRGVSVQ